MTIGSGIAIAGAFLGTALTYAFAPDLDVSVFLMPAVASVFVAINNQV